MGTQLAKNPYYRLVLGNISHNKDLIDEYVDTLPLLTQTKALVMLYEVFDVMEINEQMWEVEEVIQCASEFGEWLLTH